MHVHKEKKKKCCTSTPGPPLAFKWLIWKNTVNLVCNFVHCDFYCNLSVTFLTLIYTLFPAHILPLPVYVMSITRAPTFFVILHISSLLVLACDDIALGPGAEQEEHGPWGARCTTLPNISRNGNSRLRFGKEKRLSGKVVQLLPSQQVHRKGIDGSGLWWSNDFLFPKFWTKRFFLSQLWKAIS